MDRPKKNNRSNKQLADLFFFVIKKKVFVVEILRENLGNEEPRCLKLIPFGEQNITLMLYSSVCIDLMYYIA